MEGIAREAVKILPEGVYKDFHTFQVQSVFIAAQELLDNPYRLTHLLR
jgi:hypothetical protein